MGVGLGGWVGVGGWVVGEWVCVHALTIGLHTESNSSSSLLDMCEGYVCQVDSQGSRGFPLFLNPAFERQG